MPSLEWIKLTCDLPDKWQVRRLARVLKLKVDDVVGKLFRFWVYAENQSAAGFIPRLDADDLDAIIGKKGFALALADVGWLAFDPDGLRVPRFDEYMGSASRKRDMEAEKKRRQRDADGSEPGQPEEASGTAPGRAGDKPGTEAGHERDRRGDTSGTEPGPQKEKEKEKEKEEKTPPTPPAGGGDDPTPTRKRPAAKTADPEADPQFAAFWAAYPRKVAKPDAARAFARLAPSADLLAEMLAAIARQRASPDWVKDGGQFIPHPATWLNQRRWEDAPPEVSPGQPRPANDRQAKIDEVAEMARSMGFTIADRDPAPGGPT